MTGAEDRLARGLKVILDHGGETLTNAQVVAAIKSIQQETKRKTDNQDVFKFQDVSNLLLLLLLLLVNAFHSNIAGDNTVASF